MSTCVLVAAAFLISEAAGLHVNNAAGLIFAAALWDIGALIRRFGSKP